MVFSIDYKCDCSPKNLCVPDTILKCLLLSNGKERLCRLPAKIDDEANRSCLYPNSNAENSNKLKAIKKGARMMDGLFAAL